MPLTFMVISRVAAGGVSREKNIAHNWDVLFGKKNTFAPHRTLPLETRMPGYSDPGFDTLALHAGAAPDPATGARAVPIHLTTSFVFESSDHAAALFNLERAGHVYSRISNPTNAVLRAAHGGARRRHRRDRHRQRPGGAAPERLPR
jgi:hypothetical protein